MPQLIAISESYIQIYERSDRVPISTTKPSSAINNNNKKWYSLFHPYSNNNNNHCSELLKNRTDIYWFDLLSLCINTLLSLWSLLLFFWNFNFLPSFSTRGTSIFLPISLNTTSTATQHKSYFQVYWFVELLIIIVVYISKKDKPFWNETSHS
jgi:hypothetical protein